MQYIPAACPNIVCILAEGLARLPSRPGLRHVARLTDQGHARASLPARWQLARLQSFGYHTALIGGADASLDVQGLADDAARFIASQQGTQPFVLSLVLPCTGEQQALQRFDRAVGQVLTALTDWDHAHHTVVMLGPVQAEVDSASADTLEALLAQAEPLAEAVH